MTAAGPPQPVDEARVDVLALLSDDAKALVVGELMDLRTALQKADNDQGLRLIDAAIRRVVRGLYRYELRRVDPAPKVVDFDPTTGW
jgi:hypothetical protein